MKANVALLALTGLLLVPQTSAGAPPLPPGFLEHEWVGTTLVLSWQPPPEWSAPVDHYVLYGATGDGTGVTRTVQGGTSTSLMLHFESPPSDVYAFVVTAVNGDGESAPSNPVLAMYTQSGWPRCTILSWGFTAPYLDANIWCVFPLPV